MKSPDFFARITGAVREVLSGKPPSWQDDTHSVPKLHRFVHFCVLLTRTFLRNRCPVRASALAYTTLLALVPLLAVAVSVSSLFLTEARAGQMVDSSIGYIVEQVAPQLGLIPSGEAGFDAREKTAASIRAFIQNLNTGTLGVTGTIGLIFVAISLLATIEAAFNEIWGVERGRNWVTRIVHYWAAITFGPFLILATILMVSAQFQAVQHSAESFGAVGRFALKIAPLLMLSLAFMLFYQTMPNTKVQWRASLIGGLVGGLLWHLNGQFNIFFASRIVTTSKLYGGLSVLPVLLIGLYFSWLILLFGAQVAYAFQNLETYLQERASEGINQRGREFIAFRLMTAIGLRFQNGRPPLSLNRLAVDLSIPTRLAHEVLQVLLEARLVVEVAGRETAYSPARPLDQITCHDILESMRASHGQELPTREEPARQEVFGEFQRIFEAERDAAQSVTMLALVNRTPLLEDAGEPRPGTRALPG
ncbi:MAG TPA: YhjD/YihY/BrkB family envelope integrity protein [Verrucomicrobiae bacterium]|nr:YhjD/YihY/BrkB family envelope integrity protein [Verrucomicrobiae bacterium]